MQYSYESWASVNAEPVAASLPISDDLQELEASLTMDWDEVIAASQAKAARTPQTEQALREQLERLWKVADTHYQDNKMLAAQVQDLLNEKARLQAMLHAYELEVSRYRHLLGNLYLKH